MMSNPAALAPYLWLFTALLFLRVIGQLIVVFAKPRWLPPMEQWQSGLVPYPLLVVTQALVLWLMVSISWDFSHATGYWVAPQPLWGPAAYYWSYLYFSAMVVRYVIRMRRHPDQRWFGGTIPIIFHSIVAAFQWIFGAYQMT